MKAKTSTARTPAQQAPKAGNSAARRGHSKPDVTGQRAAGIKEQHVLDNRSRQLNDQNDAYYRSRGMEGRPVNADAPVSASGKSK